LKIIENNEGSQAGAAPKAKAKRAIKDTRPQNYSEEFSTAICQRLSEGKRVRRMLPRWGRLHIDRELPFLCVYRLPIKGEDSGTSELVMGEASYLTASGERRLQSGLSKLVTGIATTLRDAFGSFLLIELWASKDEADSDTLPTHKPTFRIVLPKKHTLNRTVEAFEQALQSVHIQGEIADVEIETKQSPCPPHFPSLIQPAVATKLGVHVMGIEVRPVYRNEQTGKTFPMVHQAMRRRLAQAYKQGCFDFTRRYTTHRPPHYHALGRRAMVKAVWAADRQLAEVSNTFDFLLGVTPTNNDAAWKAFRRSRFGTAPEFHYRPLPMDPSLIKRQLFKIPLERIEDPTLAHLFLDQQMELDRKLSLLADRTTMRFMYGSLQLYGPVDDEQTQRARDILDRLPTSTREDSRKGYVDAQTFAARANEQLDYLKLTHSDISSRVEVRKDTVGLMVSRGNLLVSHRARVPVARVNAALAHEVGTHVITYLNGRAQPFRQLYVGLPGYEELQEGLAVLAEYLVGGLSRPRLRLLAARVVAARHMIDGGSFVEVFRELDRTYGFSQRTAFNITMRIFRGGGLTKDAVYLRGFFKVLDYFQNGGALEPLLVGKFALDHVPIIQELQLRHVLGPPPLRPSYLSDPKALERLEKVRAGLSLPHLIVRKRS
jgi:uncharacterized protein (TIGR02421 family)